MLAIVRLVIRSLRARPSRTLLTAFGIILAVAVILAIDIANNSALQSVTTLFSEASGKAHLTVTSADISGQGFSDSVVRRIAGVAGVKAAIPVIQIGTLLADEATPDEVGLSLFGAVGTQLLLYGIDPTLDTEARSYKIAAGRFLSADLQARDILLVEEYAAEKEVKLGNDIELLTPTGSETFRLVGLLSREGPGQLNNGGFGVIPLEAAQEAFSRAGDLDQVDIVATPEASGGVELGNLRASLQARLGAKYAVTFPTTQGKRVVQMMDVYQMGLGFFSGIALFVGIFLIYNAFSMTVVERTRELGMLRALGMTRWQVMRQILIEAAILGAIGSAVGVGAGVLLARGLIRVMELVLAQTVKEVPVPLDGLIRSVAVGVFATLIAATLPAWQGGRISPLEAMRIRGNPREGWLMRRGWLLGLFLIAVAIVLLLFRGPLPPEVQEQAASSALFPLFLGATLLVPATIGVWERLARPVARWIFGTEGELGSRNVQRAKLRTTLTVAALMVGVAMILSIRAMTDSFKADISGWINAYIGGDLYVHSSLPMRVDFAHKLESVEGVGAVAPVRYIDVKYLEPDGGEESLVFMAVEPSSYRRVTSFTFSTNQSDAERLLDRLAEGQAVFISSVISERYGLQQGDSIPLRTRRGDVDFEIAGVVIDFMNQGLVVEGSWTDLRRYFGINDVSAFLVKLLPGYEVGAAEERIEAQYGDRYHLTMESNESIKKRVVNLVGQAFSLFDVVALIGLIVASLGVVNTLTMNVLERTQELGMLRGVGMTRRQVAKMILAEAAMIGAVGGVFGLGFGLFLSRLFLTSPSTMQGYRLTYVVPMEGIVMGLLLSLLVSQIAALWPARRAASIRIVEAIQYE